MEIPANKEATDRVIPNWSMDSAKLILSDFSSPQFKENENTNKRFRILVADRNPDFLYVLKNNLKDKYSVSICSDGKDALRIIEDKFIDLIVADINISRLNGFELCNNLKKHPKYKHIPIILMWSEASRDNKIRSFKLNADSYIEKPFHPDEFLLLTNSLLYNRELQRKHNLEMGTIELKTNVNSREQSFIKEVYRIINENLSNPEFNVLVLAKILKISRTKLYLRLKELTDLSPTELILKFKMEHSKELLGNYLVSVNELALKLGYNSANYFSKQFKEYYGMTPTQYRNEKGVL